MSFSKNLVAILLGLSFGSAISSGTWAQSAGTREGWHGEAMPEGLIRGEAEGEYLWQKDDSVMVYVPEGVFPMGSEDGDPDEKPVHEVWLAAFYIDKYEVSWRQWRLSGFALPKDINGAAIGEHKPIWGRHDETLMSYIAWHNARDYAAWAGKRLPTEAEWEKTARGTDGRTFPWGNSAPSFDQAVWQDHPVGEESPALVTCCRQGASPYGAVNMAGNVFEWVEDIYSRDFYARSAARNPVNRQAPEGDQEARRVLRGGAFVLEIEDLRSGLRNRQYAREGQDYVGFRLVLPVP